MNNAQPYPLELLAPPPGGRPAELVPQAPGDPGWEPSRAPDGVALPIITGNPPMTIAPVDTPTSVYTTTYGNLADNTRFPYSTVGKVYFRMGDYDYSCSAAVIGENAIWAAGHCLSNGNGTFHSNWIFVPGAAYNTSPYAGPWTAARFIAPARFHNSLDLAADYGVVIVNRVAGRSIRQVTGALGFAWNLPNKQLVRTMGYPSPYYGGLRRVESEGYSLLTDPSFNPPTVGIYSKMKSGASGGPWLLNFNAEAVGETNYLNGVTSYQKLGWPQIYSPYIDDVAKHLWDCAQHSTPETLDCSAAHPLAGLSLTDTGSSVSVGPGEPITYILTVENHGNVAVTNVNIWNKLPETVSFAGGVIPGGTCGAATSGEDGFNFVCTLAVLPPAATVTATLMFTAPAPFEGIITNTARVALGKYSTYPVDWFVSSQDNAAININTFVGEIGLHLTQTVDTVVLPGAPFTYSLFIENWGPLPANNVTVVDTLPAGVSFFSAALPGGDCAEVAGEVTCTLAALAQNDSVTATVVVMAPAQAGILTNLVSFTADETAFWREDRLETTVQEADLVLGKSAGGAAVQVGAPLNYTLSIENRGPLAATNVVLADTLPAGVTFVSATLPGGSCAEAGGVVTCSLDALPNGGIVTATLAVMAPPQAGNITNLAGVTSSQADAYPDNSLNISVTTRVEECWARLNNDTTSYYPVQAAVDAAQAGDVVKVAGTCAGVSSRPAPAGYPFASSISQTVFIAKSLTLRGGYTVSDWANADPAAHPTTLDALGQGRALFIAGAGISVTVEGLRLTGGAAEGPGGGGGYILGAMATLRNNTFTDNTANSGHGGGLYAQPGGQTSLSVSSNTFISNTALLGGGGLHLLHGENALVSNNAFTDNTIRHGTGEGLALYNSPNAGVSDNSFGANRLTATTDVGGGLYVGQSDAVVVNHNTFTGNAGPGGGLALAESRGVTVSNNTFSQNSGRSGGGLSLYASDNATVSNNTFSRNQAAAKGGGVYIGSLTDYLPARSANVTLRDNTLISNTATTDGGGVNISAGDNITLINNIIADNTADGAGSGGAIQNSSVWLLHSTLANNRGGSADGLWVGAASRVMLTNTIVASQSTGLAVTDGATVTLNSLLWHNTPITISAGLAATWSAQREYTDNPVFVDPADGNYHLTAGSAAIDRGIVSGITTDIDGDLRLNMPDLGADEFAWYRYYWLPQILR